MSTLMHGGTNVVIPVAAWQDEEKNLATIFASTGRLWLTVSKADDPPSSWRQIEISEEMATEIYRKVKGYD